MYSKLEKRIASLILLLMVALAIGTPVYCAHIGSKEVSQAIKNHDQEMYDAAH